MHPYIMYNLFSLVPVTLLLAVIFFVLVMLQQVKQGALRVFGLIVVMVLIIMTTLLLAAGIQKIATKGCQGGPMKMMPEKMMPGKMEHMQKLPAK